ncbi:ER membrane protein complex subunit 6 [Dermatophagoides farinae]|uniref:ER membrane protein complex subunit 6 n=2 Tax=Dermatophagoides farinae TaxID=6954 RepID=A0A9D4NSG2_DERFA|nr:ER membrane protein complex subunit 6-like [Dermatophagoides farinae]KAH7637429.1 rab5-interacting protein-like protein 2 [Dermatophagoides farinae]
MIKPSNSKLRPSTPNSSSSSLSLQNQTDNSNACSNNNGIANPSIAYSSFAITHNNHLIEYCRTSMSALAGSTAGIIGLTSLYGFAFYILMVVILWLMIMSKAGPNYQRYFTSSWHVLTNGFMGGLTTYVLFWTFLYGMVHVY